MARVNRFEELEVWKKARVLTRRVYQLTRTGEAARDFAYRDQIRRAAISVMLNIAEGFERESGDKDFKQFLPWPKGPRVKSAARSTSGWIAVTSRNRSSTS